MPKLQGPVLSVAFYTHNAGEKFEVPEVSKVFAYIHRMLPK
jgi:hypothetical protein